MWAKQITDERKIRKKERRYRLSLLVSGNTVENPTAVSRENHCVISCVARGRNNRKYIRLLTLRESSQLGLLIACSSFTFILYTCALRKSVVCSLKSATDRCQFYSCLLFAYLVSKAYGPEVPRTVQTISSADRPKRFLSLM